MTEVQQLGEDAGGTWNGETHFLALGNQVNSMLSWLAFMKHSRTKAILARLGHLRPATAFSMGCLLGVGGVKRLTITLFAGATIAVAGLIPAEEAALGALYVVIASVLVWLPIGVYLIAGRRADAWTESTQAWLIANEQRITAVVTLVFGALLIGHALLRLA